jgi:hypothetical protein
MIQEIREIDRRLMELEVCSKLSKFRDGKKFSQSFSEDDQLECFIQKSLDL